LLRDICKEFSDWSRDKIVEQTHLESLLFIQNLLEKLTRLILPI